MTTEQFIYKFQAKIGFNLFDHHSELFLPNNLKNEPEAEKYFQYAQKLKDTLTKLRITLHDRKSLAPVIVVKVFLFSPKQMGNITIDHHIEIIVDHESRLFTFEDISALDKEIQDTVEKIKQYIYDMEIIRMYTP